MSRLIKNQVATATPPIKPFTCIRYTYGSYLPVRRGVSKDTKYPKHRNSVEKDKLYVDLMSIRPFPECQRYSYIQMYSAL